MKKILFALLLVIVIVAISTIAYNLIQTKRQVWGFINRSGELITSIEYDQVYDFANGRAAVQKDGQWGFIDSLGRLVIQPQFLDVYQGFQPNGLAAVRDENTSLMGLIDKQGEWVMEPRFDDLQDIVEDRAVAGNMLAINSSSGSSSSNTLGSRLYSYGIIDKDGEWVVKPSEKRDDPSRWQAVYASRSNYLIVDLQSGRCGYVDLNGNWIINPTFSDCGVFVDSLAVVAQEDGNRALIYADGNIYVQLQNVEVELAQGDIGIIRTSLESYAFGTDNMELRLGPFEYLSAYTSNRFVALYENMFYLMDIDSAFYGQAYPKMHSLSEDRVAIGVKEGGFFDDYKYGYLDLAGNLVIAPQYFEVGPFKNGLAKVSVLE